MTADEIHDKLAAVVTALNNSDRFDDLGAAVQIARGPLRPMDVGARHAIFVTREGLEFTYHSSGDSADMTIDVALETLTVHEGDHEELEDAANKFAGRLVMAIWDNMKSTNWRHLLLRESAQSERDPQRQNQVREVFSCELAWITTQPT